MSWARSPRRRPPARSGPTRSSAASPGSAGRSIRCPARAGWTRSPAPSRCTRPSRSRAPDTTAPAAFASARPTWPPSSASPSCWSTPTPGRRRSRPASTPPRRTWGATWWCCSTSAATSWPTATSPGWPARWPTRPSWPPRRAWRRRRLGIVFGIGCDGELTPAEVLERLDEVRAAGGDLGDLPLPPAALDLVEGALAARHHRGQRDGRPLRPRRDRPGPDPRRAPLRRR